MRCPSSVQGEATIEGRTSSDRRVAASPPFAHARTLTRPAPDNPTRLLLLGSSLGRPPRPGGLYTQINTNTHTNTHTHTHTQTHTQQ